MPAARVARPARAFKKGGTSTTKKHRFEPFTSRIARLNIDPVRRIRRHDVAATDTDLPTASNFKNSLDHWIELNTSEAFTDFVRLVLPLCENLPQILHFKDRISSLLFLYIEKRDALSLEPLLVLLTQFARDLGVRFEPLYPDAVRLVASIAAKHSDVNVIEWSFTCLAWIFKYLSRLLTPDLRPTWDLMAPLMGKEHQKPFVTRFAAESMSFLLKKTAASVHKDEKPLRTIVEYVFDDLTKSHHSARVKVYQEGVMTFFADAIKGTGRVIHSTGPNILERIFASVAYDNVDQNNVAKDTACGIVVNLLHHADATTASPIIEATLAFVQSACKFQDDNKLDLATRLLRVLSTVRKGSRIAVWSQILESLDAILAVNLLLTRPVESGADRRVALTAAYVLRVAPLEDTIVAFRSIMDKLTDVKMLPHFLPFCNYLAELDRERFRAIALPYLQRFIGEHWSGSDGQLCILLPSLAPAVNRNYDDSRDTLACPEPFQEHIAASVKSLSSDFSSRLAISKLDDLSVKKVHGYIALLQFMTLEEKTVSSIRSDLLNLFRQSLEQSPDIYSDIVRFAVGAGFETYLQLAERQNEMDWSLWPSICSHAEQLVILPSFLQGAVHYARLSKRREGQEETFWPLLTLLVKNLSRPSHLLRRLSLELIASIQTLLGLSIPSVVATAILIEDTPLNLQTARAISMHARKLGMAYREVESETWLKGLVPSFCFGLLSVKFSQTWDDATETLKEVAKSRPGEDEIARLVFRWLKTTPRHLSHDDGEEEAVNTSLTPFQCSNLAHEERRAEEISRRLGSSHDALASAFEDTHQISAAEPLVACSQALKVLSKIPAIGERQSRELVPIFLSWATGAKEAAVDPVGGKDQESDGEEADEVVTVHSRKDLKDLTSVFAKFNNPKVLYKTDQVFEALLSLLANGDVEIQRPALEALLSWKSPAIVAYQENLRNLLDDARFSDEVVNFLQTDGAATQIRSDHRQGLLPVLLRLLYGRIISRAGSQSGSKGMEGKRKLVLKTLAQFPDDEFALFIQIALGPLAELGDFAKHGNLEASVTTQSFSPRRQAGLLRMIEDMLKELGKRLVPYAEVLSQAIVYCLVQAQDDQNRISSADAEAGDGLKEDKILRSVRQIGSRCLILTFKVFDTFQWESFMQVIFHRLIDPRLDKLPIETAQSPSGQLQLLSAWSGSIGTALFLVEYNERAMSKIAECLTVPSAKEEVKRFVLDIYHRIIDLCSNVDADPALDESRNAIRNRVLTPNLNQALEGITDILKGSPSKELLDASVETVSRLAPFVTQTSTASRNLAEIALFLLDQPLRRVSPKTRSELLLVLAPLTRLPELRADGSLMSRVFETFSSLFGFFRDRNSRLILSDAFRGAFEEDAEIGEAARLCAALNAFSQSRVDEPDFDKRLEAYNVINESRLGTFSVLQWRPILFNALYFVKDDDELAIRTSASFTLRRFVESIGNCDIAEDRSGYLKLFELVVLPALRQGCRSSSELVRAEYVLIMAQAIRKLPEYAELSNMKALLVGDDEEASFFNNILHIQQHRRLRALRRLAAESNTGRLSGRNISQFFIPLIEHFIFDRPDDEMAHNLAAETVTTIEKLAQWLEWSQYKAILKRYIDHFQSRPEPEKVLIRLISAMVNALAGSVDSLEDARGDEKIDGKDSTAAVVSTEDPPNDILPTSRKSRLALTKPGDEQVTNELIKNILPSLTSFLHNKDESFVSVRIPVAVAAVKVLKLLPFDSITECLPPVLTDICHILRSRAQESRDVTRKTLAEISLILGPSCFGFMLKELRGALTRGYQLHVLSYTVHSILVTCFPKFNPGDLNYCLPQIVTIIMDDIFGATGQEKDAEDYISKMKEVKSSKSFDSMELLAGTTALRHLADLVRPIQALLEEKLTLKIVKKTDELYRRIGVGLLRNESVQSRDLLIFCYEMLQEMKSSADGDAATGVKSSYRTQRYLVNLKGARKNENRGSTSSFRFKNTRFCLDILRAVLSKHDSLQTPSNLAAFIPIITDALLQEHEEVQISALRLLTTIIKVPLPEIDQDTGVYIAEAVKFIKSSASTSTELSQASLKLIAAILRERREVHVEENKMKNRLAYLLRRLKGDLEQPDRQGVTFNFLRAILKRKVLVPEVYEVLDGVASIMVTNQTRGSRDLARAVYFQFIMDYPQGKARFAKQMSFLVQNLDYRYEEGRQSVLETIHLLLRKVGDDLVQEIVATFMVPLIMVLVNDDSTSCREMSGMLVKELLQRADRQRIRSFLALLQAWLSQSEQALLVRVAIQCYMFYFETLGGKAQNELPLVKTHLSRTLKQSRHETGKDDWELPYFTLQLFSTLCDVFPTASFTSEWGPTWMLTGEYLVFPHAWVKLAATRLIGLYFAAFSRFNADKDWTEVPMRGPGGLTLDTDQVLGLCSKHIRLLRTPNLGEELAAQTAKNLLFLGRRVAATGLQWRVRTEYVDQQDDVDQLDQDEDQDQDTEIEEEEEEEEDETKSKPTTALHHIFVRLSANIRREQAHPRATALIPKAASLRLLAALCSHCEPSSLRPSLPITILLPLYHLTDESVPAPHSTDADFTAAYAALQSAAHETLGLLQKKLGTTEYVTHMAAVQKLVRGRREERKVKRRIAAVTEPERVERKRRRQDALKKARRKERSNEQRGLRRGW
ncbi:MAG: hypothetical protein M1825_001669 [Sarcosagium campestre]|nr:MAG: hypothetical protein M1825_001669 [Sarcosagium campestre]